MHVADYVEGLFGIGGSNTYIALKVVTPSGKIPGIAVRTVCVTFYSIIYSGSMKGLTTYTNTCIALC